MGFQNFRAFNLATLAVTQVWYFLRLLTRRHSYTAFSPKTLIAKIFKARYFPRHGILQAKVGFNPSYTWRSIHEALWVLQKGGY